MSQTQQEIATPKDCKKYSIITCGVIYTLCVALLVTIILLTDNPVYVSAAVVSFAVIMAVATLIVFKRHFFIINRISNFNGHFNNHNN